MIYIEEVLHPRVEKYCLDLLRKGYYQHASLEAMKQVEIALRDLALAPPGLVGIKLVKWFFGGKGPVIIQDRLGENSREAAQKLLESSFKYYRNYAAHDGTEIDRITAIRILVLASELLDLVSASPRSLNNEGGVEGLVRTDMFNSASHLVDALRFYDDSVWGEAMDDYFEKLADRDLGQEHLKLFLELDLVNLETRAMENDEICTFFTLTPAGQQALAKAEQLAEALPEKKP